MRCYNRGVAAERCARPDQDFGSLLRSYRRRAGLSQAQLAERSGISIEAISSLERGFRRRPHRETVARLAESLELNGEDRERLSGAVPRSRKMVFATPAARDEAATEIARSELSPV